MTPSLDLPKTYKVAVFKAKGEDLVFEQRPLELPAEGHVRGARGFLCRWHSLTETRS
jgi:hypothetical protein